MLLVESGKLSVSDPITRYLPDYPKRGKPITIEHLLTNTSGIPDYATASEWRLTRAQDISTRALIDTFSRKPLDFEPGARFAYSSSNFILLGAIIEKVSGMPYAKFVERRIFAPLGMNSTAHMGHMRGKPPLAAGHSVTERGFVAPEPISPTQLYASGGILSTVDDLNRWNTAISAGKLLSAANWNRMFTPHKPREGGSEYGYGFQIDRYWNKTKTIRHGGRIDGFETFAMRLPDQGLYIAVLTNRDFGRTPPYQIAQKAALAAMGIDTPGPAFVAIDHNVFDSYVGRYRMTHVPIFVDVSRSGDKYFAAATGQGAPFELRALSETRFLSEAAGTELRFHKGPDGAVDWVELFQGAVTMTAVREREPATR
jgi:CubicO group peptidase (beta-lactamase class C family)